MIIHNSHSVYAHWLFILIARVECKQISDFTLYIHLLVLYVQQSKCVFILQEAKERKTLAALWKPKVGVGKEV